MLQAAALYELTRCRLRAMRREPSALVFVFILPSLILGSLYLITTCAPATAPPPMRLAITAADMAQLWAQAQADSPQSSTITAADFAATLTAPADLELLVLDDPAMLWQQLDHHRIHGTITIEPPSVSTSTAASTTAASSSIHLTYRFQPHQPPLARATHEPPLAAITHAEATAGAMRFHAQLLSTLLQWGGSSRRATITHNLPEPPSRGQRITTLVHNHLTSFFVLSILMSTLFGMGMNLVTSRREGVLKRFLTTPMHHLEYVLSHIISRQLLLLIEGLIIIGLATVLFDVQIRGSILAFIGVSMLGTLMLSCMCFTLAARTSNTSTYSSLVNLMVLVCIAGGGLLPPLAAALPGWMQALAWLVPLQPITTALGAIAHGAALSELALELSLIGGYTLLFATLSHYLFIWYDS